MTRFAALALAVALAFAQNAPPPASRPPTTAIRIDVNLVQVDSVVTDSRGRRVSNLEASDFELLQDGQPQTISNFSYVTNPHAAPAAAPKAVAAAKPAKGEAPPPPLAIEPTSVHRTLALVVDDLGLAAENIPTVRDAIRKFIDDDMQPDDLVAVVRTGAGMGALQQFTTDKRLLHEALDHVVYAQGRVGMTSFAPLGSGPRGRGAAAQIDLAHFRDDTLSVGSLGAIRYVVNEMAGFPGRKSVVLFTENIQMIFRGASDQMVQQAVQQLSDAANRAAVVIHAVEPRGLPDFSVNAQDDTGRMSARRVSRVPAQREQQMEQTQQGMFALSEATGGLFFQGANDLAGSLRKAAADDDGYYLLGYHPDANTFDDNGQAKFHRLQVRVKKAGLHVRSRDGFFGQPGGAAQVFAHTREAELNSALQSPYAGSIHPRMTAIFSNTPKTGTFISAMVHFETADLKWSDEADGGHKTQVDVAAATFDENGLALSTVDNTFGLTMNAKQYNDALKTGMVYGLYVPVTKPGPYLVRAAVRDPATERTGSAEQFIEVPDIAAGRLALSGIVMQDAATPANVELPHSPAPRPDITGGAARRIFRRGMLMTYSYEIFNATAATGQKPDVEVQSRLFHDGVQVVGSKVALNVAADAADVRRLIGAGRVAVGKNMAAGEYVLQVIVTDKLAKKFGVVEKSVDFEVVE